MSTTKHLPITEVLAAALKSGAAQRREDEFYFPRPQKYFLCGSGGDWMPASSKRTVSASTHRTDLKTIRLMSWNIDMLVPFGHERMTAALQYLETLVASTSPDTAIVIFLQEMTASDLDLITSSHWIRTQFNITDKDRSSWMSPHYGTTALVDARLNIAQVFRVPFLSKFDRDGLFVDITLSTTSGPSTSQVLRLCNVHLESLVANPPVRPHQLSAAAAYLHAPDVACALLAGDLNAIEPFDRSLHSKNQLQDAYLTIGGEEDSEEGYTWGDQVHAALRARFGCSRMDKILFSGSVQVKKFERIGVDVKVAEETQETIEEAGELMWASDHYGVCGDFDLVGSLALQTQPGHSIAESKLS